MTKILHNTKEENGWIIKYYLSVQSKNKLPYYGIILISQCGKQSYQAELTGVFPYEQDANELLAFLEIHKVTPLSAQDVIAEYFTKKIVFKQHIDFFPCL